MINFIPLELLSVDSYGVELFEMKFSCFFLKGRMHSSSSSQLNSIQYDQFISFTLIKLNDRVKVEYNYNQLII